MSLGRPTPRVRPSPAVGPATCLLLLGLLCGHVDSVLLHPELDPSDFIRTLLPAEFELPPDPSLVGPEPLPAVCGSDGVTIPTYYRADVDMHNLLGGAGGFSCWGASECDQYKSRVANGQVDFVKVYAALRGIMQCEKRVANMMIRTCFHESGNGGNNYSGFCSTRKGALGRAADASPEHRRCENTNHGFFDHSTVVVNSVAAQTGASKPDTMAIGCFVAYEVTGGSDFVDTFPCSLPVGRCDKQERVDGSVKADAPHVLPAGNAESVPFRDFWRRGGFTMREAAALMATHTLIDGKLLNMHHFDFEYIHVLALDWARLGFRCELRQGNLPGFAARFGDENRFGFTTVEGANFNQVTRFMMRPPLEVGGQQQCTCYDPQIGGQDGQRGGWTFTINDCKMFEVCWKYTRSGSSAVSAEEAAYCQAFKDFSSNPNAFYRALGDATAKLVTRNTASTRSIDLQRIRLAAMNAPDLRLNICSHTTPCSGAVVTDCTNNEFHSDVKAACGVPSNLQSEPQFRQWFGDHYRCLSEAVLASAVDRTPPDGCDSSSIEEPGALNGGD